MSMHLAPSQDLGLQHVLENGLAIAKDQPISRSKEQVLGRLIEIFSEADSGWNALRSSRHGLTSAQRPALDRFSVFYRYLSEDCGADVPNKLIEAKSALQALSSGSLSDAAERQALISLLQALLRGLARERALKKLVSPKSYTGI